MSLRSRLAVITLVGCLVTVLINFFGVLFYDQRIKKERMLKTMDLAHRHFTVAMDAKKDVWLTNALQIAANREIRKAFHTRDREAANRTLKELGSVFKKNTGFKNVNVHLIDQNLHSFYKSWAPEKFGESLQHSEGYTLVKQTGNALTAMEISTKGLRLKGLFPVFENNQFLGIVNFEGGLNSIKRTLKPYGIDFLYFMEAKGITIAEKMQKKPKIGEFFLNQKDVDPSFLAYVKERGIDPSANGYHVDDTYLIFQQSFAGFGKTPTGLYLLGIPTETAMEAVHGMRKTVFTLSALQTGVFLFLIAGLVLYTNRTVIHTVVSTTGDIDEGADLVVAASDQVALSSQQLARGASQQAASIEETSSALEEMSAMTRQNADNAQQADTLMQTANQVVHEANTTMAELTASMETITRASKETSAIIKTIDEIAFQTNLLALNAAVEAARAGAAGAGFAVVADEVRNLAVRAADAAKSTTERIEDTVKKITDGTALVNKTNTSFSQVAQSAQTVGHLVGEISSASREQAEGIAQINIAITQMDKITQQNAATAAESASASEKMNQRASQMKNGIHNLTRMFAT